MAQNTGFSGTDSGPVRNALFQGAASLPQAPAPSLPSSLLANAIAHAAVLADTPEKWEATLAMLKRNGIDPAGYEDFEKGRAAAIAASGAMRPEEDA
jgi:hypothetical protein